MIYYALLLCLVQVSGWRWGEDSVNDPQRLDDIVEGIKFDYKLRNLPDEGYIGYKPYSDDYWPDYKRGIANRWFANGRLPSSYGILIIVIL